FGDARMGDPDIFVDASRFRSVGVCPGDVAIQPQTTTTLHFSLSNQGNFDTPLAWRITDTRGWLAGATPALEGSQTLAAGGTLTVEASLTLPPSCGGDSSLVRFITHDPFVPGHEDTCITVVRCDQPTPTTVALVASTVNHGTVTLRWQGEAIAAVPARISRRSA